VSDEELDRCTATHGPLLFTFDVDETAGSFRISSFDPSLRLSSCLPQQKETPFVLALCCQCIRAHLVALAHDRDKVTVSESWKSPLLWIRTQDRDEHTLKRYSGDNEGLT
jgi:hypothetical protein